MDGAQGMRGVWFAQKSHHDRLMVSSLGIKRAFFQKGIARQDYDELLRFGGGVGGGVWGGNLGWRGVLMTNHVSDKSRQ